MRNSTRRSTVWMAVLALSLGLASGISFAEECGPSASCPMAVGGSAGHCQPSSSITSDCCLSPSPAVNQAASSRAIVKQGSDLAIPGSEPASLEAVEPVLAQPALASKIQGIGRHTLFQVFLR